jgi:hypothetical protein
MHRGATLVLAPVLALVLVCSLASGTAVAEPAPDRPTKRVLTAYAITWAAVALPAMVAALGSEADPAGNSPTAIAFGSVGIAGMVLGPSAGHWYAGDWITPGLALRGGAAITVATLALADPHLERPNLTIPGLVVAAGLWAGGVVWDVATVPRAVHRANLRPIVSAGSVALAGTF